MASPENATSVSLRPEGVDAEGRKIPGQKEILTAWKEEKLFRLSPFVRDCIEILEQHPELLDAARPGLELSRALDRAEELDRAMARIDKLLDIGPRPIIEMYGEIAKAAEIAHKVMGAPRER